MEAPATAAPLWQRLRKSVDEVGVLVTTQAAIDRLLSSLSGGRARLITYALMAQPVGASGGVASRRKASGRENGLSFCATSRAAMRAQ